jgi:predicted membrane chloride channel (bestrophin family)
MDPQAAAYDTARATLEKKTIVQLALAFAVAVKHYLRGEEGM